MEPESIAYFSMEIALDPAMPTYSGGLGILAGDTIRSAADLSVPMVGVTLAHRKGYFRQKLDTTGWQMESADKWQLEQFCREMPAKAEVTIEGRPIAVRAWKYTVKGVRGHETAVLLLDTDVPQNWEWDRTVTDSLYGGDAYYRLCQEIILGIGGVRILSALGYRNVRRFHMNEGHASLLALELLDEVSHRWGGNSVTSEHIARVQQQCVFTTHTPVPAGHDRFPFDQVNRALGRSDIYYLKEVFCCAGELNMTYLALNLSKYVNGVAKRHGEVSRQILIPRDASHRYHIDSIMIGMEGAVETEATVTGEATDRIERSVEMEAA